MNLGAGQIYTTNYDDLIESTYRGLGLPISPVVLAKDVALADTDRTQVVKYHGDLKYEQTLVLTESSYHKRLDFESPMDLKFRSDLLGRSVLFMGYSFRDMNIRVIWFKLMQMMRDIPEADRRPSYIVRVEPNAALDELYAAVGLRTIVLHPEGPLEDNAKRVALLGSFLLELSVKACPDNKIPGTPGQACFASSALLERVDQHVERVNDTFTFKASLRNFGMGLLSHDRYVERLLNSEWPADLDEAVHKRLSATLPLLSPDQLAQPASGLKKLLSLGPSVVVTEMIVGLLAAQGNPEAREHKAKLLVERELWPLVWSAPWQAQLARRVLLALRSEIAYQARSGADEDLAYLAELAARIASGVVELDHSLSAEEKGEIVETAKRLLEQAALIYPSVRDLAPKADQAPDVTALLKEIASRAHEDHFETVELDDEALALPEWARVSDPWGELPIAAHVQSDSPRRARASSRSRLRAQRGASAGATAPPQEGPPTSPDRAGAAESGVS